MSWYALRFWIELGFRQRAWAGNGTRPADPARVSRQATLLTLAYGTRVEDANDRTASVIWERERDQLLVPLSTPGDRWASGKLQGMPRIPVLGPRRGILCL